MLLFPRPGDNVVSARARSSQETLMSCFIDRPSRIYLFGEETLISRGNCLQWKQEVEQMRRQRTFLILLKLILRYSAIYLL